MRATLSCLHRYSGLPICARPCDGIDDMCLNYEDEDNCKIPSFVDLLLHITLAVFLAATGSMALLTGWEKFHRKKDTEKEGPIISIPLHSIGTITEDQIIKDLIDSGFIGKAVQNLVEYLWYTDDINSQKEICGELFCKIAKIQDMENDSNIFLMKNMGTNAGIGRL